MKSITVENLLGNHKSYTQVTGDEEALKEHILNIYYTMLTRGIKGTYVFACDDGMREYLKKYFCIIMNIFIICNYFSSC